MKTLFVSIRFMTLMTLLTGFLYPGAMTLFGQMAFPNQSNGSLVKGNDGHIMGSELIAQGFKSEKYFWPRPSAIDYNPMPSGGSNLGPTSEDLLKKVKERESQGYTHEMLYSSASGLDPHISPEAAASQLARIAKSRGKPEAQIQKVLSEYTEPRQFGFLGQPRVNVLKLNQALDQRL